MKRKISILDQSPVSSGMTQQQATAATVALVQLAEKWGYHRFWVSEHHGTRAYASASPEIMTAVLAAKTTTIRVGTAGVMLGHYSAFKIAEQFRLLHCLFPDRIDLGVGRAAAGSLPVLRALESKVLRAHDHFSEFDSLIHYLQSDSEPMVVPVQTPQPEYWVLGTSPSSARYAAARGLPYSFASFISHQDLRESIDIYQSTFTPSQYLKAPLTNLALNAFAADTDQEAENFSLSPDAWVALSFFRGQDVPFPSMEEAQNLIFTNPELNYAKERHQWSAIGSCETVKQKLNYLQDLLNIDEFTVITGVPDKESRFRSYELIGNIIKDDSS